MKLLKLLVLTFLVTIGIVKSDEDKRNVSQDVKNVPPGGPLGRSECF